MLRDPLVVNGTAFFKTFQPDRDPTACEAGAGVDRVYAVDNCSAQAETDSGRREERVAWTGRTGIGSDLLLAAPKDGAPIVSHGDVSTRTRADLGRARPRRPGLYLWRERP